LFAVVAIVVLRFRTGRSRWVQVEAARQILQGRQLSSRAAQTNKSVVFREATRLLESGGRLALSDIVTEVKLPDKIVCNSTLWAACIGGAGQQDNYRGQIEAAGLKLIKIEDNPTYQFISENDRGASKRFGAKSVSLLAVKP
jgi:hypothetical protein